MKKLRILACAFTCCPPGKPGFSGGEDVLGWNLVRQIARFHEVWALTQVEDQQSIEAGMREAPSENLHFCYIWLPSWLRPLLRIQGGHQIYYYLWQIMAYIAARKLHTQLKFQLFHHITYANDWMGSNIGAFLPVPYIRGPGGGAHKTPKGFESEYSLRGRLWEKVRSLGQWLFRHDPIFLLGHSRAKVILACNRESEAHMSRKWPGKVHLFPVSGVSARDLDTAANETNDGGPFKVLTAGSLIRVKGFGLAIKSFKKFADEHPGSHFSIVGSGPEEPKLRSLIQYYNLEAKVALQPAMPREELLGKMAASDVFLFPSLRDGGGTVAIEAMAVGKPVVCLDSGGPGTHVTEDCGIKVVPLSPTDRKSVV